MALPSMASIGSFMSGAGSFLGGLGIGGKQKRPSYRPYMKAMGLPKGASLVDAQKLQIQGDFDARMAAAQKHGLHPLTALGVSTSQASPTAYLPGSSGPDLNAMGQGIDRMANVGRSGLQRQLDELALEQAKLSNDYLKVQIAGAQKAIASTGATPAMGSVAGSGDDGYRAGHLNDTLKSWKSDKVGIEDGLAPKHKVVVNQAGQPTRILNTDVVGDNEIYMLADYLATTLWDDAGNWLKRSFKDVVNAPKNMYRSHLNRQKAIRRYNKPHGN